MDQTSTMQRLQGEQPAQPLETIRPGIGHEQQAIPTTEVAHTQDQVNGVSAASQAPDAPQQAASTVLSQSDLAILQTAIATLDDERLLMVLVQLPAYQLVRALECLLKPVGAASCVPQAEPADNRRADRAKVFRAAKIIYNNKMSVSECSIRDLSDTGCRVVAESLAGIPDHFTLHVLTGDSRYECEVAWRKYNMMGLRFIG